MPAPATHDFVHLEISSASVLNTSVNGPLNYLIGRNLGSDDAIELEDSLEILSGSGGNRYLRLPQGTTGQRPTGAAGLLRLNTTLGNLDFHDGTGWDQPLTPSVVTYETLNDNGDIGNSSDQVSPGGHTHELGTIRFAGVARITSNLASGFSGSILAARLNLSSGQYLIAAFLGLQGSTGSLSGSLEITDPISNFTFASKAVNFVGGTDDHGESVQVLHTFDGTESLRATFHRQGGQGRYFLGIAVLDFLNL